MLSVAFVLSLAYVLGMAVTYAAVGIAAGFGWYERSRPSARVLESSCRS